jgi:TDG/mug DNA glycosylase family protein
MHKRPTREELEAAFGESVKDVIAPNLSVLFCGINPGLYTAAIGHHFGRPGNRFWPVLHKAGFTPRLLSPYDEQELLPLGYGITNLVNKATASADQLSTDDLVAGGAILRRKLLKYHPRILAILGVGAYRTAFTQPKAAVGEQEATIGETRIWVLPNPSGLNANYQMPDLVHLFKDLKEAASKD